MLRTFLNIGIWLLFGVFTSGKLHSAEPSTEETLAQAWAQYRLGEFDKAIHLFEALQKTPRPGTDDEIQGLYGEASCWNLRQDARTPAKAIQAYEKLIEKAPAHPLAAWAALDAVRARYLGQVDDFSRKAEVVEAYGKVWEKYPEAPAGEEAFLFKSNLQAQQMDPAQAETLFQVIDEFMLKHPESPFRSQLYGLKAASCKVLGKQKERLDYMIQSLQTMEFDTRNPNANKAKPYWEIAYAAEFEVGDFKTARDYYSRLIKEYPKDLRIFSAREAFKRMDSVETLLQQGRPVPSDYVQKGSR